MAGCNIIDKTVTKRLRLRAEKWGRRASEAAGHWPPATSFILVGMSVARTASRATARLVASSSGSSSPDLSSVAYVAMFHSAM